MNENSKELKQLFTRIANAIRYVNGKDERMNATDFPKHIRDIKSGVGLMRNIRKQDYYNYIYGIQASNVAKSYYNARKLGVEFKYTQSHSCLTDGVLTDENGYCLFDCSTFIGLVLRGIEFKDSPYYHVYGQPNRTLGSLNVDLDFIPNLAKRSEYDWAFTSFDKQKGDDFNNLKVHGYRSLRTASHLAEYFYQCGQVLYENPSSVPYDLLPGDLVFWAKPNASEEQKKSFRSISHVGIIGRDANTVIHVTGYEDVKGDTVFYAKLINNADNISLIIRPNYCKGFKEVPLNTNIIPNNYFSENITIEDLEKIENNIVIKQLLEGGFSISRDTVGDKNNYYWLVAESYNLELSKGKYYLSGCGVCPSASDDTTVRDFGLLIYDVETGLPIENVTGAEVIDKGEGDHFEISETTKVKICLYTNSTLLFDEIKIKPTLIRYE